MEFLTLCWDCKHATDKRCSWAKSFKPVKCWVAEPTEKVELSSYKVIDCPLFERDSWGSGKYREKPAYLKALATYERNMAKKERKKQNEQAVHHRKSYTRP